MSYQLKNSQGKHYTKQLFHEMWIQLDSNVRTLEKAPFCLWSNRPGQINFGKVYVELGDPSGYKITQQLLNGDFKHWVNLNKCSWFLEAKTLWDQELEAKLFAEGIEAIKDIAKDENHKGRLSAARVLVDKGYASKIDSKARRGRPSTQEVQGQLRQDADAQKALNDDLERIRAVN